MRRLLNKQNRRHILLILGSGVLVGALLNLSFGVPMYHYQGIIGAITALFIVLTMS